MLLLLFFFFFFNDTATTEIYTLSLHDALPICAAPALRFELAHAALEIGELVLQLARGDHELGDHVLQLRERSEEHTSELQSLAYLVCRLLLEKKKKQK